MNDEYTPMFGKSKDHDSEAADKLGEWAERSQQRVEDFNKAVRANRYKKERALKAIMDSYDTSLSDMLDKALPILEQTYALVGIEQAVATYEFEYKGASVTIEIKITGD